MSKRRLWIVLFDLYDMISFLIFVGGIVLFVRFFVANPYTVIGASMEPTFSEKDFIIVDKITQRFSNLNRGDIIVFVPTGKTIPYIKRIVGMPGETIKVKDGFVYVCTKNDSCEQLQEDYIGDNVMTEARCGLTEFYVGEGAFFVLGDHRGHSTDSLCCFGLGCYEGANYTVPFTNIIGKVYVRILPSFGIF